MLQKGTFTQKSSTFGFDCGRMMIPDIFIRGTGEVFPIGMQCSKNVSFILEASQHLITLLAYDRAAISVPGVTLRYLFKTLSNDVLFTFCSEKQKELHITLRNNVIDGSSIIFHRFHEKNKTCRGDNEKVVHSKKGYDSNAFYLSIWFNATNAN